jgi:alpha-methylacyl-CoA racemase
VRRGTSNSAAADARGPNRSRRGADRATALRPGSPRESGPLAGVLVLDLSTVGPAARCTRLLADYGAEVVKVLPTPRSGVAVTEPPFFAYGARRGMRRVLLDLKQPGGREAFFALVTRADVVVETFRPGVADRLGIGYESVRAANSAIVYCSTSGYGAAGHRSGWAGHDIDYLGIGGFLAVTEPRGDGGPPLPGATVADAAAGGMQAALAITTALLARARTGEGTFLDVSVADGVVWLMSLALDEQLATGSEPAPYHDMLSGRYACYGVYRAGDGRWLAVGAIEPKFFANLCRALDCARWFDHQTDDAVQDEIRADFARVFATKARDEWVAELAGADTCVAPVLSVAEVAEDEELARRGTFVPARHPVHGSFRQVGPVLAGAPRPVEPVPLPDPHLTDTEGLLKEAGVDPDKVAAWMEQGVVA